MHAPGYIPDPRMFQDRPPPPPPPLPPGAYFYSPRLSLKALQIAGFLGMAAAAPRTPPGGRVPFPLRILLRVRKQTRATPERTLPEAHRERDTHCGRGRTPGRETDPGGFPQGRRYTSCCGEEGHQPSSRLGANPPHFISTPETLNVLHRPGRWQGGAGDVSGARRVAARHPDRGALPSGSRPSSPCGCSAILSDSPGGGSSSLRRRGKATDGQKGCGLEKASDWLLTG